MVALNVPLMLEGDIAGSFSHFSPGEARCLEQWLLQNPGLVLNVLSAFRDAGADILPAMTFGANVLKLSDYDLVDEHNSYNARLVELAKKAAPEACIAGGLAPTEHACEPFGPLPYTDLVDTFAEQAIALASAGAEVLLLREMTSLLEARAAVAGGLQASVPILLELAVAEDGKTILGTDPLAALICLQELGIAAFGLSARGPEVLLPTLRRIVPYAKVPLIARPGMTNIAPEQVSRDCWELIAAGAHILGGGPGATAAHMQELRILLNEFDYASFPPPAPSKDPALRLCDDGQVYFIDEEPQLSDPIPCSGDMAASIARAEAQGADVLLFDMKDYGEAYEFSQNCHLCRTGVCLMAENAEALERGISHYCGRALLSTRSNVEPEVLLALAKGYGGIVFDG